MIKLHPQVKALWEREGCEPLRYDYDLNPDSLVLDIGGSMGNFAHGIISRYDSHVIIYEPLNDFFFSLTTRFHDNPKVILYKSAVYAARVPLYASLENEAVTLAKPRGQYEVVDGVDIADITVRHIDLLKLNIEGSEYDVLERLIETNVKNVDNIQVQFHITSGDSFLRRFNIQEKLSATHKLDFCFEFVWESWRIKK